MAAMTPVFLSNSRLATYFESVPQHVREKAILFFGSEFSQIFGKGSVDYDKFIHAKQKDKKFHSLKPEGWKHGKRCDFGEASAFLNACGFHSLHLDLEYYQQNFHLDALFPEARRHFGADKAACIEKIRVNFQDAELGVGFFGHDYGPVLAMVQFADSRLYPILDKFGLDKYLQAEAEQKVKMVDKMADKPKNQAVEDSYTPVGKLLSNLKKLRSDGVNRKVYGVFQTGALNPPHSGHVEMLAMAKDAMESKGLAVAAGWMGPTGDWYVRGKATRLSDPPPHVLFDKSERYEVSRMMVEASDHSSWLDVDGWDIFVDGFDFEPHLRKIQATLDANAEVQRAVREAGFDTFELVYVMGNDHFQRCCSGYRSAVVIGRSDIEPAMEKQLQARAQQYQSFVYQRGAADMAELSSTKFRRALAAGEFNPSFCPKEVWDYLRCRLDGAMMRCGNPDVGGKWDKFVPEEDNSLIEKSQKLQSSLTACPAKRRRMDA